MKEKMKMVLMMMCACLIFSAVPAAAEEAAQDPVSGDVSLSALSAYIWRGQELSRHSVVLQPSATVSYKGFSANIWGNLDTKPYSRESENYAGNYTETDVTLSYARQFGIVNTEVGYIYYALASLAPGGTDPLDTQEVYISVGLDTLLAPTLKVYKDIDHYHQWYATLGISHTFEFHERVSLDLAAQVSYLKSEDEGAYPKFDANALATADKYNNFHDGMVSASLPISITDKISITPTIAYVFPLVDDAKYEMQGRGLKGSLMPTDNDSAFLYGGVVMSFSF
ncbi:MAG: hypothetical protein R6W75_11035 [Smithellaceae bacterium]